MAKKIEFELPEGFQIPEQLGESGEFESLATVKLTGKGGKVCLVAIDGYRMPGYQENDGPSASTDEDSEDKSYASAASEGAGLV